MTHNFSSPSIHQISTPTSLTYKLLYNTSLLGWLPIFSLSTLLKLNFFLLDLNNNSLKYRTALLLQPTPLATLVIFLTNTLPSRIKSLHFLSLATITSVNFAVSAHTLTSKQPTALLFHITGLVYVALRHWWRSPHVNNIILQHRHLVNNNI